MTGEIAEADLSLMLTYSDLVQYRTVRENQYEIRAQFAHAAVARFRRRCGAEDH